jgi:hypothetical protein
VIFSAGLSIACLEFAFQKNGASEHSLVSKPIGRRRVALWLGLVLGIGLAAVCGVTLLLSGMKTATDMTTNPFVKNVAGPPIEWRFDKPVTILFYSRKQGEGVWIEALQVFGTNKTDRPFKRVRATIVPDMTERKLEMRVNPHGTFLAPSESATLIPPRADFDLMLTIPAKSGDRQGLPAEQFIAEYGGLKFIFEYDDGQSFTTEFPLTYLEDQISFVEEKTKEQRRPYSTPERKTENEKPSQPKNFGPTSAGIELASIGLIPPAGISITDEITAQSLSIGFLNICNSEGKETLFRRSWTALSNGRQIEKRFSHHKFYVAVENKSLFKTLRNARLVVTAIAGPGGRILNDPFLSEGTHSGSVDVLPGAVEYFLIGEGIDDSDAGMFHPKIVSSDEYDHIIAELNSRKNLGFLLKTAKAGYPLLRNNGERIHIAAYAEDVSPVKGLLVINARERIEVWLTKDNDT